VKALLRACNKTPDSSQRHLQTFPDPGEPLVGCDSKILDIDSHSGREENCFHPVVASFPTFCGLPQPSRRAYLSL
jgi:hypothetical protein